MAEQLIFNKHNFIILLESLSKMSDTAILNIKDGEIYFITNSADYTMVLWGNTDIDFDKDITLNIPAISKLLNALKMCDNSDNINLKLNNNNLEYKGNDIKFKYHLYEDGLIPKSKMTLGKIKSINYNIEFNVPNSFIKKLLRTNSAFSDTKKMYIYTEDGSLHWSLQDKTVTNGNVFSINSGEVDFELDTFIINLDNLRFLNFVDDHNFNFKINTSLGVGNINLNYGDVDLNYIITSLIK